MERAQNRTSPAQIPLAFTLSRHGERSIMLAITWSRPFEEIDVFAPSDDVQHIVGDHRYLAASCWKSEYFVTRVLDDSIELHLIRARQRLFIKVRDGSLWIETEEYDDLNDRIMRYPYLGTRAFYTRSGELSAISIKLEDFEDVLSSILPCTIPALLLD